MIRTLLASTAVAALLATGAVAQQAATPGMAADTQTLITQGYQFHGMEDLASRLIGTPVFNAATAEADRIGEVNDLIIAETGEVNAVLIGVGGFLGVGQRDIAVSFNDLEWSQDQQGNPMLVIGLTQEQIAAAPAVEIQDEWLRSGQLGVAQQPMQPDEQLTPDEQVAVQPDPADPMVQDETVTGAIPAEPTDRAATGVFDPAGATAVEATTLTAEQLRGMDVYGPDNQHIGPISDLVLADDGQTIDALVIDFGGFLGIGVKPVAVGFDNLQFLTDQWGTTSLVLPITREQMEAAPHFDADTFAMQRDQQLLRVDGTAGAAAAN